jgi:molecular chaperone HtpG
VPDTPAPEKHEFKAEVAAVLRLVTNSLYTNREIFLRELISNASDALDKARFGALVDKELLGQAETPKIWIIADKPRNVLIIEDNGIGMTKEEASRNLGTIAHSGTLKFLQEATTQQAEGKKPDLGLIGQFGVGFYSAFMIADRIDVFTRSATPGDDAVHWSSTGDGGFTIAPTVREGRGTRIELHLKDDAKDFLDRFRIESIVRRYSNFVLYPIFFQEIDSQRIDSQRIDSQRIDSQRIDAQKVDSQGIDASAAEQQAPRQINEASAFWTLNPKDLEDKDYQEFYKHVMGGFVLPGDQPLGWLHLSLDAPIQFKAVLFIPGRRPADLFGEESKHLQLYARRVLVMDSCDKLLPLYLRFLRGVVDSEDLPLNVSRELLQEHKSLAAIRRQLTRKVLNLLSDIAKDDPDRYEKIWRDFGVFLKEGLHIDNAHRDQLTGLLRFVSTASDGKLVSLSEYVASMPAGQQAIYYITGDKHEDLAASPHLEACRARGYPVLLMNDAVDEWVMQDLHEFEGKPLHSVTQGDLAFGDDEPGATESGESKADQADGKAKTSGVDALLGRAKAVLGDRVKDVVASKRLTQSASCLVDLEGGIGRNMERILRMAGREVHARPRILELNPKHEFVQAANAIAEQTPDDPRLQTWIELLFDQANLAEGHVIDPAGTVRRIQSVLDQLVRRGSSPA